MHYKRLEPMNWPVLHMSLPVLLEVPNEILAAILSLLDIKDIIRLRSVCKHLCAHTRSRLVWVQAVHAIVKKHALFDSTFPVEHMSAEQLEQAATRPSRLQKNVAAGTVKRLTIRRVTLEDSRVVCICLIPGGRWMLSGSLEGSLSCWDLNVRPGQTSLSRVAEISFPCPSLHICAQAFSGDSAIVLLRTQGSVQRALSDFYVIRFTHTTWQSTPELVLVNSLIGVVGGDGMLEGDYVAIKTADQGIIIWNWLENTWGGVVGMESVSFLPGTVAVIRPPHIITEDFDRSSFKVYEIPVLSPRRSDIEQIPFVRARPVRKVPMDTKLERLITTTTWTRSNPYSPSYFAGKSLHGKLLFFTGNSSPSLPLHNVPKAPIPAYVPLASGYTFDGSPLAVRCLGDHMVTVSLVESRLTKRNLVIQAYPTRSSSIESKSLRKTQQFDISGFPMAFDICFVTGRGCYVEASELRLLEFDP